MTIELFKSYLKTTLEKHPYKPYKREKEGLVYIGTPTKIKFLNTKDKYEFVYLLCMFIALDLKSYDIYREFYQKMKNEFYIPKFEYGLKNIFMYPQRIFLHYKIGINKTYFNNSFETFYSFSNELTQIIDIDFKFKSILESICNDPDLQNDKLNNHFIYLIKNKT